MIIKKFLNGIMYYLIMHFKFNLFYNNNTKKKFIQFKTEKEVNATVSGLFITLNVNDVKQ